MQPQLPSVDWYSVGWYVLNSEIRPLDVSYSRENLAMSLIYMYAHCCICGTCSSSRFVSSKSYAQGAHSDTGADQGFREKGLEKTPSYIIYFLFRDRGAGGTHAHHTFKRITKKQCLLTPPPPPPQYRVTNQTCSAVPVIIII